MGATFFLHREQCPAAPKSNPPLAERLMTSISHIGGSALCRTHGSINTDPPFPSPWAPILGLPSTLCNPQIPPEWEVQKFGSLRTVPKLRETDAVLASPGPSHLPDFSMAIEPKTFYVTTENVLCNHHLTQAFSIFQPMLLNLHFFSD